MSVTCAWCLAESGRAPEPPVEGVSVSHGICARHRRRFVEGLPARSFPGVSVLVVVARGRSDLHDYLMGQLAGLRGVSVIVDRRLAQRRREHRAVPIERRVKRDRRNRQGLDDPGLLGHSLVRFSRRDPGPREN